MRAQIDLKTFQFAVPVTIHLDPRRLGVKVLGTSAGVSLETVRERLINSLVAHGVRAQLRTGNLLTGAVYVALDVFPGAAPAAVDWAQRPVQLPTVPGQLEQTEESINRIITKLDKLPLQQIGDNLQRALGDLDLTLVSARGTLSAGPRARSAIPANPTAANSAPVHATRRDAAGGEPGGAVGAGADGLPRAASGGVAARQAGSGEVRAAAKDGSARGCSRSRWWRAAAAGCGHRRSRRGSTRSIPPRRPTAPRRRSLP